MGTIEIDKGWMLLSCIPQGDDKNLGLLIVREDLPFSMEIVSFVWKASSTFDAPNEGKKKGVTHMMKRLRISLILGMLLATLFTFGWGDVASAHSANTAATATTSQAAVACFNQAFSFGPFTLTPNVYEYPSAAPWFVTSSSCTDINVNLSRLTHSIQMQVCFISTQTCNSWKTLSATGHWYQIATNVRDGTSYRFGIKTTQTTTMQGQIAD